MRRRIRTGGRKWRSERREGAYFGEWQEGDGEEEGELQGGRTRIMKTTRGKNTTDDDTPERGITDCTKHSYDRAMTDGQGGRRPGG